MKELVSNMFELESRFRYQYKVKADPYDLQMTLVRLENIYKLIKESIK